jgi:hypothetical protein
MATCTAEKPAAAAEPGATAFTETAVTFQGPEGFPLAGIFCEPSAQAAAAAAISVAAPEPCCTSPATVSISSGSSSRPFSPTQCAVLCHGFASHKNGFHFPAMAQHLATQLGMSSLRFDYTGMVAAIGRRGGGAVWLQTCVDATSPAAKCLPIIFSQQPHEP